MKAAGNIERAAEEPVVKVLDGPWAKWIIGPVARRVTAVLEPTAVTPNQVTAASFSLAVLAALAAAGAAPVAVVLLLQGSFLLDMVDGQLARATGKTSRFGAFLDRLTDRVEEVLLYAGAAMGAGGGGGVWALAFGAISIVLLRDAASTLLRLHYGLEPESEQRLHENGWLTRRLREAGWDDRRQNRGFIGLVKSFLWFGIGERWTLLSVALLVGRVEAYFFLVIFVMGPAYALRFIQKASRVR